MPKKPQSETERVECVGSTELVGERERRYQALRRKFIKACLEYQRAGKRAVSLQKLMLEAGRLLDAARSPTAPDQRPLK